MMLLLSVLLTAVQPITFHKREPCSPASIESTSDRHLAAHPDPTLYPVMLKEYVKKLKRYYGWSEEDFYRRVA